MKNKRNTKFKGMTLVEVIVALAVFTIMASLLVTACMSVSKSVISTNRRTREINVQAPLAENRKLHLLIKWRRGMIYLIR